MAIKIYGTYYSPATNRSLVVLHEKKVEFELVLVSVLAGDEKKPEYLALQPFGLVSLLQDGDDVQIYERALVEQWLDMENGTFSVIALDLIRETLYKPAFAKVHTNPKTVVELTLKLVKVLDICNVHLATYKYLVSKFMSIADLAHLSFGWLYFEVIDKKKELLGSRKYLAKWWEEISTRPA